MRLFLLIILVATLGLNSCRQRIETIPPLSAPLLQEELARLPGNALLIIPKPDRILVLCDNGALIETPSGRKLLDLNQTISKAFLVQPDHLVIQSDKRIAEVFIKPGEVVMNPLPLPGNARLLTASASGLVYAHKDRLIWASLNGLKTTDLKENPEHFLTVLENGDQRIQLFCNDTVYSKRYADKEFRKTSLDRRLDFPPTLIGRHIWAMDSQRRLLKYRNDDLTLLWSRDLDHKLLFAPVSGQRESFLITHSATLLAVNERGTQAWYAYLGGLPLSAPLLIDQRIAVPVRVRETVQLRIYDRHGRLLADHPLGEDAQAPFLLQDDRLLYLGRAQDKTPTLQQASTLFAVSSNLAAMSQVPKDTLLPIEVSSINLIRPSHKLTINDSGKKTVWTAQIGPLERKTPVWKPEQAGNYTLLIETDSQNHSTLQLETPFTVFDRTALFRPSLDKYLQYILRQEDDRKP